MIQSKSVSFEHMNVQVSTVAFCIGWFSSSPPGGGVYPRTGGSRDVDVDQPRHQLRALLFRGLYVPTTVATAVLQGSTTRRSLQATRYSKPRLQQLPRCDDATTGTGQR